MNDRATTMDDGMSNNERASLELKGQLSTHEALCAMQWKAANARLTRIEYVLFGIVLLLLFGEGTVLEVVKRLFIVAK